MFPPCDATPSFDTAPLMEPKNGQARKGRPSSGLVLVPVSGSKNLSEKKLPQPRKRLRSDSSTSFALFSSSDRAMKLSAISSCSDSDSDSDSGFFSGHEDTPLTKRGVVISTRLGSKPCAAAGAIPSHDCDTFMASCDRLHTQCKLVRTAAQPNRFTVPILFNILCSRLQII
jgi:hypothetical protein